VYVDDLITHDATANTGGEAKIIKGVATRVLASEHYDYVIRELAVYLNTSVDGGIAGVSNMSFTFITSSMYFLTDVYFLDSQKILVDLFVQNYSADRDWLVINVLMNTNVFDRVEQTNVYIGVSQAVGVIAVFAIAILFGCCVSRPMNNATKELARIINIDVRDQKKINVSQLHEFASMENSLNRLKNGIESFKRFVPRSFLKNMGVFDLADTSRGTIFRKNYAILVTKMRDVPESTELQTINGYYASIALHISKNGGFIARHADAGCAIAFFANTSQAIQSAIDIFEDCVPSIISINYAPITVATVGEQEYMECSISSSKMPIINLLHAVACKFKTDIIISKSALQQSRYSGERRWIGRYKLSSSTEELDVYEILITGTKRISYPKFKTALQMYQQGKGHIISASEQFQLLANEFSEDDLILRYQQQCNKVMEQNLKIQGSLSVREALRDPVMNTAFEKYCNSEFCAENVQIWNLVQNYLETRDEQHVQHLLNKFIMVQGPPSINIHKDIWTELNLCAFAKQTPSDELLLSLQRDLEYIMEYRFQKFKQLDEFMKVFFDSTFCSGTLETPTVDMQEFMLPD
jgi:hypothetical protein